jgi:membrane protein
VVAAYAPSLQMRVTRLPDLPGARFQLAVNILRSLATVRETGTHGYTLTQISEVLRMDPLQIEPILETLVSLDWAGRLDEAGSPRYVLLCDPAVTKVEPLLKQTLLMPSQTLSRFWQQASFSQMTLQAVMDDETKA